MSIPTEEEVEVIREWIRTPVDSADTIPKGWQWRVTILIQDFEKRIKALEDAR